MVKRKKPLKNQARESITNMPLNVDPVRFRCVSQKPIKPKREIMLSGLSQFLDEFLGVNISITISETKTAVMSNSNVIKFQAIVGNIGIS